MYIRYSCIQLFSCIPFNTGETGKVKLHFPDTFTAMVWVKFRFFSPIRCTVVRFIFRIELREGQKCHESVSLVRIPTACLWQQLLLSGSSPSPQELPSPGTRPETLGTGDHYRRLSLEPAPPVHSLNL